MICEMTVQMPEPQSKSYRILVVDDEPSILRAYQMMLEFFGYQAAVTSAGHKALQMLDAEPFDLVITDYSMPGMKGDELIAEVRRRMPGLRIVMVTAFAEDIQASGNRTGGADCVLPKPFGIDDLRNTIANLLAPA